MMKRGTVLVVGLWLVVAFGAPALAAAPDDADAHHKRAVELYKKGDFAGAEAEWLEALSLDPKHWKSNFNLGRLYYYQAGDAKKSEKYLRAAAKLKPDDADVHYNLAVVLVETDRFDEGEKELNAALKLAPTFASAHYNLGLIHHQRALDALAARKEAEAAKLFDKALAKYDEALKHDPGHVKAYVNGGLILARRGDLGGATKRWAAAKAADGQGIARIPYNLGLAYAKKREFDKALAEFRDSAGKAKAVADKSKGEAKTAAVDEAGKALYYVGATYRRQGKPAEAMKAFEDAIDFWKANLTDEVLMRNAGFIRAQRTLMAMKREELNK